MSEPTSNTSCRNFGLDLVRALAILIVVYGHGFLIVNKHIDLKTYSALSPPVPGVALFFGLSGFLIGGILIKYIENNNGILNFNNMLYFWKRRWMRTLPNYFFVLIVSIIILQPNISLAEFFRFATFTQNIFSTDWNLFFRESWSLSIEEWFYLLFPVVLFISLKFTNNAQKAIFFTVVFFILYGLVSKIYYAYTINISDLFKWDIYFRTSVFFRLDAIVYGVFAAYVYHYRNNLWNYRPGIIAIAGIVLLKLAALILLARLSGFKVIGHTSLNNIFFGVMPFFLYNVGVVFLLPFASSLKAPHSLINRAITHISKISYSMYLLNLTIFVGLINRYLLIPESLVSAISCYIGYWIGLFVVSTLLYKYFEKPIMDMRK